MSSETTTSSQQGHATVGRPSALVRAFAFIGRRNLAPVIALAALFLGCALFVPAFRRPETLLNLVRQNAPSGVIALGMTLVIAGGGIDLSVGSLVALCGVVGVQTMVSLPVGTPAWVQLLVFLGVALGVGVLGGALNGALVNWGRIPPFIATLGTYSIFRSVAKTLVDARTLFLKAEEYPVLGDHPILGHIQSATGGDAVPVAALLLGAVVLAFVLRLTRFGWRVCAVGGNEKAAIYAGVNVRLVRFLGYAAIGLLCGIGAFLLTDRLNSISSSGAGSAYELDAIAAVIIGGTPMSGGRASVWGTLAGVFILGIIGTILVFAEIPINLQDTFKGLIIILAVLFQYKKDTIRS